MKTGNLYRKINHTPATGRRYTEVEDANYLFNEYGISVNKVGALIRKESPNTPKEEGTESSKPVISKEDVIMTLNTPLLEVYIFLYII